MKEGIKFDLTPFQSEIAYTRILAIFRARLEMKHLLKGTSFRTMKYPELRELFVAEIEEFDKEMDKNESDFRRTKAIEEAIDIMICAMMLADKLLGTRVLGVSQE